MNYGPKDIFLERRTTNNTFEEAPLHVQPNSVVVSDANGNLAMVDTASFVSGTGSIAFAISSSVAVTSSFSFTASWSSVSLSSSYALNAVSASYAVSASFATNAETAYAINFVPDTTNSASWVSASAFITMAQTTSFVTASNVVGAVSTAITAYTADSISFVPNSATTSTQSLYSTQSIYATQSIFATQSVNAYSASWVSASAFITMAQTASYVTASNVVGQVIAALNADTASLATSISFIPSTATSASWVSASAHIINADTASYLNGIVAPCITVTSNYALSTADYTVSFSGSSPLSCSLPSATDNLGHVYNIKNKTSYNITVTGSQNIDGGSNQIITQWNNLTIQSDGIQWIIL